MSGEIEAMGALGTAGLVARSLDHPAGGAAVQGRCANCAAPLSGHFCAQCGQKAHLHRTLGEVGHEILHGVTHFDGKAWTTLPMLLFRPGKLTRDYIMGHRARYIAPVPLFLLVVFTMFFTFSFVKVNDNRDGPVNVEVGQGDARESLAKLDANLAKLDAELAAIKAGGPSEPGQEAMLKGVRVGMMTRRGQLVARVNGTTDDEGSLSDGIREVVTSKDFVVINGADVLNARAKAAFKNPDLVLYKIQGKAYKLSFLLVPLSLPWLWLLFAWKRGVKMYDHAIFALYSISFMSLLFIIGSIGLTLGVTAGWFWGPLLFVAPPLHLFTQLKGAYALSNFSAGWRTIALSLSAFITLSLYALIMLVLGVID